MPIRILAKANNPSLFVPFFLRNAQSLYKNASPGAVFVQRGLSVTRIYRRTLRCTTAAFQSVHSIRNRPGALSAFQLKDRGSETAVQFIEPPSVIDCPLLSVRQPQTRPMQIPSRASIFLSWIESPLIPITQRPLPHLVASLSAN